MTTKRIIAEAKTNGQGTEYEVPILPEGDAAEPEKAADTSFDYGLDRSEIVHKPEPLPEPPNPLKLDDCRLDQEEQEDILPQGTVELACRKPDKSWWVRVHPDKAYRTQVAVLQITVDKTTEYYLLSTKPLRDLMKADKCYVKKQLSLAINKQGVPFIWEATLPREGQSRDNKWPNSALEAMDTATKTWTRVWADMSVGKYVTRTTDACQVEPKWPELPFEELLEAAFKGKRITQRDHPIIKELLGEA